VQATSVVEESWQLQPGSVGKGLEKVSPLGSSADRAGSW
jgi:hypothetical protein